MSLGDFDTGPPEPRPRVIPAEYETECSSGCSSSIAMGDDIAYSQREGGWVHYPRCWR